MNAEGNPHPDTSLFAPAMRWFTRMALLAPAITIGLAVCLALAGIAVSYYGLTFRTSRLDLLNPKSDYNRLWINYIEEFGEEDDAVDRRRRRDATKSCRCSTSSPRAVAGAKPELFHAVLHEVDLRKIRSKGLHYRPPDELLRIEQFLREDWSRSSQGIGSLLQLANCAAAIARCARTAQPAARSAGRAAGRGFRTA